MKTNDLIKINTIEEFTERMGSPPANHPLISIFRVSDINYVPLDKPIQLNLYSIVMKDGAKFSLKYGWREYDFSRGYLNFCAPGQVHSFDDRKYEKAEHSALWGWFLVFHPDFIRKYPLGAKIGKLKFFSYETNEALHMSDEERALIDGIMENIQGECKRAIDAHCQDIIVSQIDVLLNYSERFYTRQFITRNSVESEILTRFQSLLHEYFDGEKDKLITAKKSLRNCPCPQTI